MILLGYSYIKYSDSKILAFYCIYFSVVVGKIFSHKLINKISYQYKSFRILQEIIEEEAECLLMDSEFSNQVRYNCSLNVQGKEIEIISSYLNFNFTEQEVEVISYTPISLGQSQNLLEISETNIFDKKLYILDNSIVYLYNINGTMEDVSFPYHEINLTLNLDNNNNKILNATCSSNKSDNNNYILNCYSTRKIKGKIITAFSTFEKENLLVNVKEQTEFSSSEFFFFSKNSSKLSSWEIIAIIIATSDTSISLILSPNANTSHLNNSLLTLATYLSLVSFL